MKHTLIWLLCLFILGCAAADRIEDKLPPPVAMAMKEIRKGSDRYQRGCYAQALEHFFRAHELLAANDHLSGVAMSLNNIGTVYRATGDADSAVLFFEAAGRIYADAGDAPAHLQARSNMAAARIDQDRLEDAERVLRAAEIDAARQRRWFAPLVVNRGILLTRRGEYPRAEALLTEVLAKASPEDVSVRATAHSALGELFAETGQWAKAAVSYEAALAADRASGFHKGMAGDLAALGAACLQMQAYERALGYYDRGIKIFALLGEEKRVLALMAELERAADRTGVDIGITRYFVRRWLAGEVLERPCE